MRAVKCHDFTGGKCVLLCSGSKAVEYGVRVVQSIISRPMPMTMADSYFGAYGEASIKREAEWFGFDGMACDSCRHPDDCSRRCEHWASISFHRIGGFLFAARRPANGRRRDQLRPISPKRPAGCRRGPRSDPDHPRGGT